MAWVCLIPCPLLVDPLLGGVPFDTGTPPAGREPIRVPWCVLWSFRARPFSSLPQWTTQLSKRSRNTRSTLGGHDQKMNKRKLEGEIGKSHTQLWTFCFEAPKMDAAFPFWKFGNPYEHHKTRRAKPHLRFDSESESESPCRAPWPVVRRGSSGPGRPDAMCGGIQSFGPEHGPSS